jgi:hypothetical protein
VISLSGHLTGSIFSQDCIISENKLPKIEKVVYKFLIFDLEFLIWTNRERSCLNVPEVIVMCPLIVIANEKDFFCYFL